MNEHADNGDFKRTVLTRHFAGIFSGQTLLIYGTVIIKYNVMMRKLCNWLPSDVVQQPDLQNQTSIY